ncbi:hypothetical protein Tsubulata_016920 [Turnera subulata]|uniref:Uncharacterized protein n=1 Tax=Turnera subulata TaxID=218843 RepID=A0A9Q0JHD1_9ROSI|nr:hypothetical protein Tsubulata_016920 [Turnera subulata]
MASAQVLPGSRKQHLQAGKKLLEEFRKKKAAGQAKKTGTASQPQDTDLSADKKPVLETESVRLTDSDGAGTSNGPVEPFGISASKKVEQNSLKDADFRPPSAGEYNGSLSDMGRRHSDNHDLKRYDASAFYAAATMNYEKQVNEVNDDSRITGSKSGLAYRSMFDHSVDLHPQASQGFGGDSSQLSVYGKESFVPKENSRFLSGSAVMNDSSLAFPSRSNSASSHLHSETSNAGGHADDGFIQPSTNFQGSGADVVHDRHGNKGFSDPGNSSLWERNFGSSAGGLTGMHAAAFQTSELSGSSSDFRSPSSHVPLSSSASETSARRSRPSFLDSLNVPRPAPGPPEITQAENSFMHSSSKSNGTGILGSYGLRKSTAENESMGPLSSMRPSGGPTAIEHSINFSVPSSNGVDTPITNVNEMGVDKKQEFYSSKQNDDFAALEQHIEDLTQEKYSLQRALEASRALAESLASENSSMTDSYNQQRSIVNQLKSDMEKLQEEIKAHLVELEAVKMEYGNAQLECNAADERAKLLASEVIGLEEKALRLRSNELKLERQLENSYAEISSYKKKMSSLEKDRQDLQSTIDALQEEKKLLQSKLRKASGTAKSIDISRSPTDKKDVSTTTDDLGTTPEASSHGVHETGFLHGSDIAVSQMPESDQLILDGSSVYIPPDQLRMIQNINALMSELALEKEELMQAFASESSQCLKLKDLNNELSRKLEAQTQRLELLTAQSMSTGNAPARSPDPRTIQENTTYADEGDEVVDRVLGWIMKLFPGGPSRRRTSKLL